MEDFQAECQLTDVEEEMIDNLFQRCDTNGDGHIHVQTVIGFLKNCLGNGNNEPDLVVLTDILESGSHAGHISRQKYREGLKMWILKIRARCDSTSILDTDGMLNSSFDADISGLSGCIESSGLANGSCEKRIDTGELLGDIEELKHQNQRLSEENGQLHTQLESQEEVVNSLTAELYAKQQTEEQSKRKVKSLQEMLDLRHTVMEENEELKVKLGMVQEGKKDLDVHLVAMERENTDIRSQLTNMEESWQRAVNDNETTTRELQAMQTASHDLKNQLFQAQDVKTSADDLLAQKCEEIENLKQKLQDFMNQNEKLQEEKDTTSAKLSQMSCQLKRYQRNADSYLLPDGEEEPVGSKLLSPKPSLSLSLNRHSICMELKDRLKEDKHLPSPLCEKVELLFNQRPVMLPTYMASWELDDSFDHQNNFSLELLKKTSPQLVSQVDIERKLSSLKDLEHGALQREIIHLYRVNVELSEKCHTAERREVELEEELTCLKQKENTGRWSPLEDVGASYCPASEEDLKDLWKLVHSMTGEEDTEIDEVPLSYSTSYLRQQIKDEIAQLRLRFHGKESDTSSAVSTPKFTYFPGKINTPPLVDTLNKDCLRQARTSVKHPHKFLPGTMGPKRLGHQLNLSPAPLVNHQSVPITRHRARVGSAEREPVEMGQEASSAPDRKDIPKWFVFDSTSQTGIVDSLHIEGNSEQSNCDHLDPAQLSDVVLDNNQLPTEGRLLRRLSYTTAIENQTSSVEEDKIPRVRSNSFQAAIEQGQIATENTDHSSPVEECSKRLCWSRAPRLSSTPMQLCKPGGRSDAPGTLGDQTDQSLDGMSDSSPTPNLDEPCQSLHEEFFKSRGLTDKGECQAQQLSILLEEDASGQESPFLSPFPDTTVSSHQISSILGSVDTTHSGDTPSTHSLQHSTDDTSRSQFSDRSDTDDRSDTNDTRDYDDRPDTDDKSDTDHPSTGPKTVSDSNSDRLAGQTNFDKNSYRERAREGMRAQGDKKVVSEDDSYQLQEMEEGEEEEEYSHEAWTLSRSPTTALRDSGHSSSVGSLELYDTHESSYSQQDQPISCTSQDKVLTVKVLVPGSVGNGDNNMQTALPAHTGKLDAVHPVHVSKGIPYVSKNYIRPAKLNISLPARFSQESVESEPGVNKRTQGDKVVQAIDWYSNARNLSPSERILKKSAERLSVPTAYNTSDSREAASSSAESSDSRPVSAKFCSGCEAITSQFEKSCVIHDSAMDVSELEAVQSNVMTDTNGLSRPVDVPTQSIHSVASRRTGAGRAGEAREGTLAPLLEISPIPSPPLSPRINFRQDPDVRSEKGMKPSSLEDMAEAMDNRTGGVEVGQGDGTGPGQDVNPSNPEDKVYKTLSRIRQNHLARRRDQLQQSKMPQLSELAEKDGAEEKVDTAKQNGHAEMTNGPDIMPNIPDEFLQKLGLDADSEDSENSDELSEQEIESKFSSLSLAFKTDSQTLEKRLEIQERARDIAEQNVDKELEALRNYLTTLNKICTDPQVRDVLNKIQSHLDVLEKSTARVSSRAEVYGAIQQEKRMSKAVDIMVHHVENIRRVHEREHAELEEARKLLQDSRSLAPTTLSDLSQGGELFSKRSASVCPNNMGGKATTRRRVSEIALPKVLGGAGVANLHPSSSMDVIYTEPRSPRFSNSPPLRTGSLWDEDEGCNNNAMPLHDSESIGRNIDKDARTRFQSAVASATLKSVVANTMRRASLEKQNNVQSLSPAATPPHVSRDNSADSAKLSEQDKEKQKNLEEEAFKKGYEQGMRASLGQDLSSLREQQNRINENLGAVMDSIDNQMEEPKTLKEILVQHYHDNVPKLTISGWRIRLTFGCFFFVMAFLSVIMALFPVSSGEVLSFRNCRQPYV